MIVTTRAIACHDSDLLNVAILGSPATASVDTMNDGARDAEIHSFPTAPDSVGAPAPRQSMREAVGDVLRDERHDQERTLADVAEEAAVSLPYLSEIERGRKDVSSELLSAVCDALGVEIADVLERTARQLRIHDGTVVCSDGPSCGQRMFMLAA